MALLDHKAKNLREAIQNLEPVHSLEVDELDRYFVARESSPIGRIAIALEDAYPQKFLFTGHRGNGKSTELAKLEQRLQSNFFVVRYSLKNVLDLYDLTYVDVLLSIAIQMAEKVNSDGINLSKTTKQLLEKLWSFGQDIEQESEKGTSKGAEAEVGIGGALATLLKLSAKLKTEHSTRTSLREKVKHRISELLEGIDIVAQDIRTKTKKDVLCIVEDLDKTDPSLAEEIFYKYGKSISDPHIAIIYTFPIALSHSNEFTQIINYFDGNQTLHNFKLVEQDGSPSAGQEKLKLLLENRLENNLLENDAVDLLVDFSGGLARQLIVLAREACLEARVQAKAKVTAEHAKAAIARERQNFARMLTKSQLELLKQVHETKTIDQTEEYRDLLHNLSVLEYDNGKYWYDVNPLVLELLS